MTIITDETKKNKEIIRNAGKECEKVGQAGRVPDGGIKLQYSVYHPLFGGIDVLESVVVTWIIMPLSWPVPWSGSTV